MALLDLTQSSSGNTFSIDENDIVKMYTKGSQTIVEFIDTASGNLKTAIVDEAAADIFATATILLSTTFNGSTVYLNALKVLDTTEISGVAVIRYQINTEIIEKMTLDVTEAAFKAAFPATSDVPVLVGTTLFVSSQGKTVANGAVRESLTNHFSTIAEAWTAASAGDTIVVYPGAWSSNTTFSGKDVNWYFMPGASMTGSFSWGDAASTRIVTIGGYGEFSGTGTKFNVANASSVYNVTCKSISTSNVAIQHTTGTGTYNVSDEITSSNGSTCYIDGAADVTINAKDITNTRNSTVTTFNIRPTFTGTLSVNADYISANSTSAANVIVWEQVGSTGTAIFNVKDKIISLGSASNACICLRGGASFTFNGNIDGGVGRAIQTTNAGNSDITHNGNATNDGTTTLVDLTNTGASTIRLNGEYTSANQYTITQNGSGSTLHIKGRVVNSEGTAIQKAGVYVDNQTATIIEDATIVVNATGTPNAAYAPSAVTNLKVYKMATTHTYNANISNTITGALEVVDTDVQ